MSSLIQIAVFVLVSGVVLTLTSEGFALAMSRVVEAGFERIEYRLALRTRSRAERLKSRRREERRRATRARDEHFAPAEAYYSHAG
jgi:hypothetical protein